MSTLNIYCKFSMNCDTKVCNKCKQVKTEEEFHPSHGNSCKKCMSEYRKARYAKGLHKAWKKPEKSILSQYVRKSRLKKYDLTKDQYESLVNEQHGRCAICGIRPLFTKLVVDHDHNTGKFRGLLCYKCNVGLGFMRDDPEILNGAIMYLRRTSK